MGRPETKKNLQGDIPAELHEAFTDWIAAHRDIKIRQALAAMVELWLTLPESVQALLLIRPGAAERLDITIAIDQDGPEGLGPLERIGQVLESATSNRHLLLSEEESRLLENIRQELSGGKVKKARKARKAQ